MVATCCVRGYPTPIISINGHIVLTPFNLSQGVYEGCAVRSITPRTTVPGTTIVSTCSVVLTQTIKCTTKGFLTYKVSMEAIKICNAALHGNHSVSRINLIVGECRDVVYFEYSSHRLAHLLAVKKHSPLPGLEKSFLCQSHNLSGRTWVPFFWSHFLSSWSQSCAKTQKLGRKKRLSFRAAFTHWNTNIINDVITSFFFCNENRRKKWNYQTEVAPDSCSWNAKRKKGWSCWKSK